MTPLETIARIAVSILSGSTTPGRYRRELKRRLTWRGWTIHQGRKLPPGSRGDDTHYRAKLDLLCTPPGESIPVLVELDRHKVSFRTRAKLQAWGARPNSGLLVLVLYARPGNAARLHCPEASLVAALSLNPQVGMSGIDAGSKRAYRARRGEGGKGDGVFRKSQAATTQHDLKATHATSKKTIPD